MFTAQHQKQFNNILIRAYCASLVQASTSARNKKATAHCCSGFRVNTG
jgi:hypothetical protein